MFDNKTILITGGTGSFGKRYVAYILANYKPKKVIIYIRNELKQLREKLRKLIVPEEMAHHSLEFDDHFVIAPVIKFFDKTINYLKNKLGEVVKSVDEKFDYHSGTNHHFISAEELIELDKNTL